MESVWNNLQDIPVSPLHLWITDVHALSAFLGEGFVQRPRPMHMVVDGAIPNRIAERFKRQYVFHRLSPNQSIEEYLTDNVDVDVAAVAYQIREVSPRTCFLAFLMCLSRMRVILGKDVTQLLYRYTFPTDPDTVLGKTFYYGKQFNPKVARKEPRSGAITVLNWQRCQPLGDRTSQICMRGYERYKQFERLGYTVVEYPSRLEDPFIIQAISDQAAQLEQERKRRRIS